jgi:hypothetical protein
MIVQQGYRLTAAGSNSDVIAIKRQDLLECFAKTYLVIDKKNLLGLIHQETFLK